MAAIDDLPDTLMGLDLDALGLPPHARTLAYWRDTIAGPLASRLLADHLDHRLPPLYQLLVVLGAIDEADPARRISLDALGDALADPAATLRGARELGLGRSTATGHELDRRPRRLSGLPARIVVPPAEAVELVGGVAPGARAVEVPIAPASHGARWSRPGCSCCLPATRSPSRTSPGAG